MQENKLKTKSGFSQMHKIGKIGITTINLQFTSLFATYDVNKYENRYQWM